MLYGAHEVGQSYYRQLETTGYAKVVQWLDDKFERHLKMGMPVDAPDRLGKVEFDAVVIAMGNQKNVREIGLKLLSAGVPLEKIVWMDKKNDTWLQTYKTGILASSKNNLRNYMDDVKRKLEGKLRELNELGKKMEIAESFILDRLTVALECKGEVLSAAEVLRNIQIILTEVDRIICLQLMSKDVFAYPEIGILLEALLNEGQILKLEMLDCGKTMPNPNIMGMMRGNEISISLMHDEGELPHHQLMEIMEKNHIAVRCIFPDIRIEEAATRRASRSLVLSGESLYRCPEGELIKQLPAAGAEYYLGSLGECLKARIMEAMRQEMRT